MEIIKEGKVKDKFVGRSVSCNNCCGVFQLDKHDKPYYKRTIDRLNWYRQLYNITTLCGRNIDIYAIKCPTKNCHSEIEFRIY